MLFTSEGFGADVAAMRSLSCMLPQMVRQMLLSCEGLGAELTSMG